MKALKKLLLGETWLLPIGLVAVIAVADGVLRPLLGGAWEQLGGFVVLAGVLALLVASVVRSTPRR